jgi:hypothetical protein
MPFHSAGNRHHVDASDRSENGHSKYFQHLHALAITTGVEKFGGPKLITASVPGKGAGSSGGQVRFDALQENPRASLVLVNSAVILISASSSDRARYHGWVMAYDAETGGAERHSRRRGRRDLG